MLILKPYRAGLSGLAFASLAFVPLSAQAQAKPDHLANLRGKAEVPTILTANNYTCDLLDAYQGPKPTTEIDGKRQALQIYEIACAGQRGALIRVTTAGKIIETVDCYQADYERKSQKDAPVCLLPLNKNNHIWLDGWVKPLFPKCEVSAVVYIGRAPDNTGQVYEVACKGGQSGGAGFYTLPHINSVTAETKPLSYLSCLRAAAGPLTCSKTDTKGMVNHMRPLAETGSKGCSPANARFMGGSKENLFYELQCSNGSVFVTQTDAFDQFRQAMDCSTAEKYGAKCQYEGAPPSNLTGNNDKRAVAQPNLAHYNVALKAAGKTCTAIDARIMGQDASTQRDLVEIKCQETPYGLVGYLPASGSTAATDVTDCFTGLLRQIECRYFNAEAQKQRVSDLADESTAIKADCVVTTLKYVGATADQELTVEIACENKRGYIAVLSAARDQILRALPCRIAANRADWEKCSLPDNGSYAG
ncbi:MAG: hypothetical protein QM645_06375 [Asticcacaulis sp.]